MEEGKLYYALVKLMGENPTRKEIYYKSSLDFFVAISFENAKKRAEQFKEECLSEYPWRKKSAELIFAEVYISSYNIVLKIKDES